MTKGPEWKRAAVETVKVGDGIVRLSNGANYTCTGVEVSGNLVRLSGGLRVGNPGDCPTHYTECYRVGETVWHLPRKS